jgi:hypothetical protein
MTDNPLTTLAGLARRLTQLEADQRHTRQLRDEAIRAARGQGYQMPVIANAAGVSVATVKALTTGPHALKPEEYADPKAALFLRDQGVCALCRPVRKLGWEEWTPGHVSGKLATLCLAHAAELTQPGAST